MAGRLGIKTSIPGLTHLWNVSQQVGGRRACPNLSTDVELVKVLVTQALKSSTVKPAFAKVSLPPLVVNSQFDAVVGYWIFRLQDHDGHPIIDGIVSPARGVTYAPGTPWVIGLINARAFDADEDFWRNLPQNPSLSPQLRSELSN
jgi:hypothetical protein